MKNNKGFSLVELIIVIAIMAVLVGVMAPQYIKYVEKSRISTDDDNAAEILTAVTTALSDEEVLTTLTTSGSKVRWVGGTITADDPNIQTAINDTLGTNEVTIKSTKYKSSTYTVSIEYYDGTGFHAYGCWDGQSFK